MPLNRKQQCKSPKLSGHSRLICVESEVGRGSTVYGAGAGSASASVLVSAKSQREGFCGTRIGTFWGEVVRGILASRDRDGVRGLMGTSYQYLLRIAHRQGDSAVW